MDKEKRKYTKKNTITPGQLLELGKLPPQAVELEEAVLGAVMLDHTVINQVTDILKPEMFYKEAHQIIFKACVLLFEASEPIDILTVVSRLKNMGELELAGGASYVTKLTNRIASSANVEMHSRIVLEKFMRRELIMQSTNVLQKCFEDEDSDIFQLLDQSQTLLNDITAQNIKTREKNTDTLMKEFKEHIERASTNTSDIKGVATTIDSLNRTTNGWQNSDLIIIAGRPGSGKTAFTKSCIKGAIQQRKKPVLMFSLEMAGLQIMTRFISEETGVPTQDYLSGSYKNKVTDEDIHRAGLKYYDMSGKPLLIIDDTALLTINELKARAKRIVAEKDPCLIIVDYLQLLTGSSDRGAFVNRVAEVSEITRGLKALAKETNLPVICLAQLNREVEAQGGDMRPKLSHLRESGSIEQDADIVIFLYRPEYYAEQGHKKFETIEIDGQIISSAGYAELGIAKHRNGALKTERARFVGSLTRFEDWHLDQAQAATAIPAESPYDGDI